MRRAQEQLKEEEPQWLIALEIERLTENFTESVVDYSSLQNSTFFQPVLRQFHIFWVVERVDILKNVPFRSK